MSTQVGRISGPLLTDNLLRNGVDLAFETDLLYLNVSDPNPANHKIGIKTQAPLRTLNIDYSVKSTDFIVDHIATIDNNTTFDDSSRISTTFQIGRAHV